MRRQDIDEISRDLAYGTIEPEEGTKRFEAILKREAFGNESRDRGTLTKTVDVNLPHAGLSLADSRARDALSRRVQMCASQDPDVVAFRENRLAGLKATSSADAVRIIRALRRDDAAAGLPLGRERLPYLGRKPKTKNGAIVRPSLSVREGGMVLELLQFARTIAGRYRWSVDQAVSFLLCPSVVPIVSLITAEIAYNRDIPELTVICLRVHPRIKFDHLKPAYHMAASRFPKASSRRVLSDKMVALADFVEKNASSCWRDRLAKWNRKHPGANVKSRAGQLAANKPAYPDEASRIDALSRTWKAARPPGETSESDNKPLWHYSAESNFRRDGKAALKAISDYYKVELDPEALVPGHHSAHGTW